MSDDEMPTTDPEPFLRGLGFKPDRHVHPEPHEKFAAHLAAVADADETLLEEAQFLEPLLPEIGGVRDQKHTNSCVGWALAECIALRLAYLRKKGFILDVFFPSPTGIYTLARAEERRYPETGARIGVPLQDVGSEPGLAFKALSDYGVAPIDAWPFDEDKINDEPTWDETQAASGFIVDGYFAIDDAKYDVIATIRRALGKGIPIPLATVCDDAFMQYTGEGILSAPTGRPRGGHMIELIGFKPDTRPGREGMHLFRLLNHWDVAPWGDGGLAWVDEEFVLACTNRYALTITIAEFKERAD